MKIKTWVDFESKEIEVSISAEDIVTCLSEDPNQVHTALRGISNAASFIKAIPPVIIDEMSDKARETIRKFFIEQSERFATSNQGLKK
jgi:hypothetical protein